MEKYSTFKVLSLLVKQLDISVTNQEISDELQKHPNPNSLLAISDLLNNWQVPNAAFELSFDELVDSEIAAPFIVHIKGNDFILIKKFTKQSVIASGIKYQNRSFTVEEFKLMYDGWLLVAEKDDKSGDFDYVRKRKREFIEKLRKPVAVTGILTVLVASLLLYSSYLTTFSLQIGLLTLFKTLGIICAIFLLIQSIDANNPLIVRICGSGLDENCNAILSSDASKVVDGLSWSEMGFFYFGGTWVVLVFNSGHPALVQMLAILNILSLPYTFYSIHYQWRIARQWCVFCCITQAFLWAEFLVFIPAILNKTLLFPNLQEWCSFSIGMLTPVLIWIIVKPYLLQSKEVLPLRDQLREFKFNPQFFQKMLDEQWQYSLPAERNSLVLGNPEAKNVITVVSNPFCQPCAKAHKILEQWIEKRDDIKLQVIFSTENNEKDPRTKVVEHLFNIQATQSGISLKKAMKEWYEHKYKDYEFWAKKFPIKTKANVSDILDINNEWCQMAEVLITPSIFINGRRIPAHYEPEDIKYFI